MKFIAALSVLAGLTAAAPGIQRRQAVSSASEALSSLTGAPSSAISSAASQASSRASSAVAGGSASASASAAAPSGSQDYATGLVAALQARDATTLASLIAPLGSTLGPILQNGEWTLFAPSNQALQGVDTSNVTALANILQYHVARGQYPAEAIQQNVSSIPATLLQGAPNVNLPNNAAQALPFTKDQFGTTRLIGQNASVLANSTYQNILIKLIDNVLTIPPNITGVLSSPTGPNASALVALVGSVAPQLVGTLDSTAGVTVFAPSNAAVQAISGAVGGVQPSALTSVIEGHVLPQVVYSTNITNGASVPTLAGGNLTVAVNGTGVFVTSNGATARVIQTDFVAANGVVHVIDAVLFNPSAGAGAASASGSGASSAPGQATSGAESASSRAGGAASSATGAVGGAASSATSAAGGALSTATAAIASATS